MKYAASLTSSAVALLLLSSHAVNAQTAASTDTTAPTPAYQAQVTSSSVPVDVQPGSWAYSAVSDLASKGLIAGYPPDAKFLGGRALTRYEMATIIARVLDRVHDLDASGQGASVQSEIDEIRRLTDDYKVELTVIGTNMTQAQADIAKLQGDVSTLQAGLNSAYDSIEEQTKRTTAVEAQVKKLGDTAYTSSATSKFNVSGYIQFRAVDADSSSHSRYPQGTSADAGAYNGNYAQGGSAAAAEVRRARIKFAGAPTNNVKYAAQVDFSGAVATGTANQQVTVREANFSYTFGDGTTVYPTLTAGLFANPFGYILPLSMANSLTPERPLAFSEANNVGLWDSQDYDKGLKAAYGYKGINLTYALVNGDGRQFENDNDHFDSIYRVNYQTADKQFGIGTSYYDGKVARNRPTTLAAATLTYPEPKKQLFGVDAQMTLKNGIFADGEFVKGTYEKRSYFDENLATTAAPTGADALITDGYVKNNQVEGFYVWGGYSFAASSPRPLTLGVDYDYFDRSINAHANALDALQTNNVGGTFYTSSGSFIDRNIGYGALYNLDKATRLRLWYDHPYDVAHATGTPDPPKIGLYTAELQVRF